LNTITAESPSKLKNKKSFFHRNSAAKVFFKTQETLFNVNSKYFQKYTKKTLPSVPLTYISLPEY